MQNIFLCCNCIKLKYVHENLPVSNALTTAQSVPNLSTSSTTTSQCTMSSNVANLTSLNLPPLTASFSSTSSPHNPHLVASNEQEAGY